MLFNFVVYFVIPWVFGIILYNKDRRIFLTIFPFSCMVAYTINILGIYLGYWNIYPLTYGYFSSILLSIGLYPILGTYFVYLTQTKKIDLLVLLAVFSIVSTVFKWVMLSIGRTIYGNGWNIYFTFIAFLTAYLSAYAFYMMLKKRAVIV